MPTLIAQVRSEELAGALDAHLADSADQVKRLEDSFANLDATVARGSCAGMRGILDEASACADEDAAPDASRDAALIGCIQHIEHYEIASYGSLIAHAKLLELDDVVDLLSASLHEEQAADQALTEIADAINMEASNETDDNRSGSTP